MKKGGPIISSSSRLSVRTPCTPTHAVLQSHHHWHDTTGSPTCSLNYIRSSSTASVKPHAIVSPGAAAQMGDTSGGRPPSPGERALYEDDGNGTSPLTCCCGKPDCDNLRRNNAALTDLERDVQTAAHLGQALLKRHEIYVLESERERKAMLSRIAQLEEDKRSMERDNGTMIEDNRELLKQLELLNKTIVDSDEEIKGMAVALQTTKNDMQSLAHSAMRVEVLEDQLNQMELDQVELNQQLEMAREDESLAINRWKKAEYMLKHLEDELTQLEQESREERERHNRVIERMERRRAVERELETAAARLKGAAAATSSLGLAVPSSVNEAEVVTTFVHDILADNATLQAGIVELRDMLDSSNDEVQILRERLLMDRPSSSMSNGRPPAGTSLGDELTASLHPAQSPSELHVHHHHYHTPLACNTKVYLPPPRRQRRRRTLMGPGNTETPGPSRCKHRPYDSLSSISTILSQTAATIPSQSRSASRHSSRWTSQSSIPGYPMASLASSPQSHETASIFSRMERGFESSRPTSPESTGVTSPPWKCHSRSASDSKSRSSYKHGACGLASPIDFQRFDFKGTSTSGRQSDDAVLGEPSITLTIPEEGETHEVHPSAPSPSRFGAYEDAVLQRPLEATIRRVLSRGSMAEYGQASPTPPKSCLKTTKRLFTAAVTIAPPPAPIVSETNVAADKMSLVLRSRPTESPAQILHKVADAIGTPDESHSSKTSERKSAHTPPVPAIASPTLASSTPTAASSLDPAKDSTTQRNGIGGWVFGKWGVKPTKSSIVCSEGRDETTSPRPSSVPSRCSKNDENALSHFCGRPTGVNQKGPVPGLKPPPKAPAILEPPVDHELLRETLQECCDLR